MPTDGDVAPPKATTLTATNEIGTTEESLTVHAGPPRPNIVLFLVEDMGPMDTSAPFSCDSNGTPVPRNFNNLYVTPAMEALAANGMRFTNAHACLRGLPSEVNSWQCRVVRSYHTGALAIYQDPP